MINNNKLNRMEKPKESTIKEFECLKDWGYEDEEYTEEDETLFAIENNFPPSNMTEKEWNKGFE